MRIRATTDQKKYKAFSLIEVLLGVSLFLIVVTGVLSAIAYVRESSKVSEQRIEATQLAKEGIEFSRHQRDISFDTLVTTDPEDIGVFTRTITVSEITSDQVEVVSVVEWSDRFNNSHQIEIITHFTDWRDES